MSKYPNEFEGFQIQDQKKWSDFKKLPFKPKKFEDHDVDVLIEACGVCGSDLHTINGGWGDCPLPICVGHEVIGKAIKVGKNVTLIKEGQRVGVGAQVRACMKCQQCKEDNEHYCPHQIATYGVPYEDDTISQGGFASHIRAHEYFVFPIPDGLSSELAAPMLCAGITTYSPLERAGVGPGKKVGIVGIGGLGHHALLWASALGAEVWALSHSSEKQSDAKKLGAKHFVDTNQKDWHKPLAFTFDFILNCTDSTQHLNLADYLSTLRANGTLHNVGIPDAPLPTIKMGDMLPNGSKIAASHLGNRPEMLRMLKLAADKKLQPMIETVDISEKGCKEAIERLAKNQVHYRFTLVNFDKAFPNRGS